MYRAYCPALMPVGCTHPIFHDSKMHANNNTEKPTLKANARAMRLDFSGALALALPPRNMKNRAAAKLAMMARNASATRYDIDRIIR